MKKNLMFVMNQMTPGGAERVVSILANKMSEREHNVSLVITFDSDISYELNEKINLIKFNISRNRGQVIRNLIEIRNLINTFKKEKPDVIISFIRNVNCIIAAKIVGIPVIISERNNPKYDPKSKLWRILRILIYPYADGIVFQTEGAKSYFSKRIQSKSCIIKNPLSENIPIKESIDLKNKVISVGRLCEQKNQKILIKAFRQFHEKYPEYKLEIYGEGNLREDLEKMTKELGMENYITMPGNTNEVYNKIINSDVFVLSSIYEGYPNVLIEAMSIGMPVISTDCEYGPKEIIRNYENGILVPKMDFEKLAEELCNIVSNKELRAKLGGNAKKIRGSLKVDKIVNEWTEYILKII